MPGFFEAITFLLLAAQAGALGAGIAGVIAVYGSTLLGVGLSVGLSYLSSVLFRPKQPKPEDVQQSVKNPIAPRQRHYGRVKTSGPWVFAQSKHGDFHKVLALGTGELDAIEELWCDDNIVEVDANGFATTLPYNDTAGSFLAFRYRLGLPTETHYSDLEAAFPEWDEDHVGHGVASIYGFQKAADVEGTAKVFPNTVQTSYRVVARGSKVYNPSNELTEWTDNAAAIIRDYMTHPDGMRLPLSLFTTTQATAGWLAAYNRCNEAIPRKAGGTEARYRLWGSYSFDERPADVLGRMLASCDGRVIPTPDGGITLDIGTWAEPSVVLNPDAIVGFSELSRGRDIMTTANVISATYLSPNHDYQSTDADRWIDEDDVSERGEIVNELQFNMSPSHGQARRLMKLAAYRAKPSWVGQFQCNMRGLAAFGERFVRITYPLFEIDEVFEIVDFRFEIGEGNILSGVTLQVQSMPEEAYDWDAATEEGEEPLSEEVIVDNTIPVPDAPDVSLDNITVGGGVTVPVAHLEFDAPPAGLRVEAHGKRLTDGTWTTIAVEPGATDARSFPLDISQGYEFQIRYVTVTGRRGDWSASALLVATPSLDFRFPSNSMYLPIF